MMVKIKPALFGGVIGHKVAGLPETVGVIAAAIGIGERENTRAKRSRFAALSTISGVSFPLSKKPV